MNDNWKNWKEYLEKLRSGEKKLSKNGMLILFLTGVLLFVIVMPTNNNKSYLNNDYLSSGEESVSTLSKGVKDKTAAHDDGTYQNKLETELAEFLSGVEGVGKAEVLIYLDASEEYIIEKDVPSSVSETVENDAAGGTRNVTEQNREEGTVYTMDETGNQIPFVTQTRKPKITGVIIAAEGGTSPEIQIKIVKTVQALYGIEANKIEVLGLKK